MKQSRNLSVGTKLSTSVYTNNNKRGAVMKKSIIKSFDNEKITCYCWDDVKEPLGVVQIIHGMAEHALRYGDFAKFLNNNGYIVFADDHRAHGKTAGSPDNVGKYNRDGNVFYDTMRDELFFTDMLKDKYNLPIVILGHSYGSLITQKYIQYSSKHAGVILSGSAYMKTFETKLAYKIAKITKKHKGNDAPAKMIENLSFNAYNKKFKDGLWICSNPTICKQYIDDPYCGVPFSAKFYCDLMGTMLHIYSKPRLEKINKDIPMLLVAGKKDLFGKKGKSVIKLYKTYVYHDIHNVNMKLYDNMRHEILNEVNNSIVYNDILAFVNLVCGHSTCDLVIKSDKRLKKTKPTMAVENIKMRTAPEKKTTKAPTAPKAKNPAKKSIIKTK